jgi:hypothetical protein
VGAGIGGCIVALTTLIPGPSPRGRREVGGDLLEDGVSVVENPLVLEAEYG